MSIHSSMQVCSDFIVTSVQTLNIYRKNICNVITGLFTTCHSESKTKDLNRAICKHYRAEWFEGLNKTCSSVMSDSYNFFVKSFYFLRVSVLSIYKYSKEFFTYKSNRCDDLEPNGGTCHLNELVEKPKEDNISSDSFINSNKEESVVNNREKFG